MEIGRIGRYTLAALFSAFVGVSAAQDAKTVLADASKALGVDTLNTVEFSATGFDFVLGQAYSPSSPWPRFINKTYTRAIDFRTPASKVDRVRMQGENPPRGGGLQPVIGEQPQSQTIIVGPNTPWVQQLEIWMLPHGFVRAAMTRNATVATQTVGGKRYNVVTFIGDNKAPVRGYFNDQHLVEKVDTKIDSAYLGDMLFEASYSDYRDFNGVKFQMKIAQKQGDLKSAVAYYRRAVSDDPSGIHYLLLSQALKRAGLEPDGAAQTGMEKSPDREAAQAEVTKLLLE